MNQEKLFEFSEDKLKEFAICEGCGEYCNELFESLDEWDWLCKTCKKEELQFEILENTLKELN